ncbi:hypothetical protein [Clostridium aminobutyricum]|uniref:Uncharacterized protein n=1 Tax=Clostridium aminobutyricum TaxID=33953 RepID=A0A939IK61_CLOAM|nr:hypothetical protein [Clostridium aminobutyricum]MBN7774269.1 hypothetical protein [Clostridium aminobutyricum]
MMYYYAYLDERDIVQMIYSLPAPISSNQFILIPTNDQTLIGKKYNRETGEFEEIVLFYYAVLGEKDIVINVIDSEVEIIDSKKIKILSKDLTLIGKWYDRQTKQFLDPPIHILAELDTGQINIKGQDKWLQADLDEMKQKQETDLDEIKRKQETDLAETRSALETNLAETKRTLEANLNEIKKKLETVNAGVFGGYKCHFRIRNNEEMTREWVDGKRYTFNFDTGISGYFPKMIRLISEGTHMEELVADLYIVKNPDGSIKRAYLDKAYFGTPRDLQGEEFKRYTEHDIAVSDYDPLRAEVGGNGKKYDEGACAFIQSFSHNYAYVAIGKFDYTENTLSFNIMISEELVGYYTNMKIEVFVF